jgi:formylglycine-generating enzyme required for sulfatase activity
MNTNLLYIVKHITAQYGADILNDSRRVNSLFADLAKDEPRPAKRALIAALEAGFHQALRNAGEAGRGAALADLARRLHQDEGYDLTLCADTLELLAAALCGEQQAKPETAPQCAACGNTLQEGWKACPYCGAVYGAARSSPPQPAPPQSPPVQPRIQAAPSAPPESFVQIQGGTFMMGSPANEPGRGADEIQHQVTVSAFYMGEYEVTQREWCEVMGNNPSHFKGDNLPVEQVSWYDAVAYCNRRSEWEGLKPAYTIHGTDVSWNRNANGCRLPTEAEWEYACRAGTSGPFNTGSNITTGQAIYDGNYPYNNNAKGANRRKTVEAGSFAANAWGLYDMHGNVYELCWDWYGNYSSGAQIDPAGPSTGSYRVIRGGSWNNSARGVRSSVRNGVGPSSRGSDIGFRLARSQ